MSATLRFQLVTQTQLELGSPTHFGPTSTLTPSVSNLTSFVGNTPSTVLFFLAMSVGVVIACLFIFFTVRYFVRSRYGLHVYPVSPRGVFFSGGFNDSMAYAPSNRELQEHLDYLRAHHFLRDEFLERSLMTGNGRRRRRRRRGRYAKMKKLTPEEVEKLFPRQLYADWMHTGDDTESVPIVHKYLAEVQSQEATPTPGDFEVIELRALEPASRDGAHDAELLVVSLGKNELHFDLGTCAICLELYEDDDVVRGLICGHVFHSDCVDPWLTRRRACCPICKRDYYKDENENTAGVREADNETTNTGIAENETTAAVATENETSAEGPSSAVQSNIEGVEAPVVTEETNAATVTPTAAAGITTTETRDDESINYELLRQDPNLQALLSELIPLSERVRVILEDNPGLDLEAQAREISNQKYRSIWRKIFWKLMGISKENLFNWAVVTIFNRDHASDDDSTPLPAPATDLSAAVELPVGSELPAIEGLSLPTNDGGVENVENATTTGLPAEIDVSEATRRETVERMV